MMNSEARKRHEAELGTLTITRAGGVTEHDQVVIDWTISDDAAPIRWGLFIDPEHRGWAEQLMREYVHAAENAGLVTYIAPNDRGVDCMQAALWAMVNRSKPKPEEPDGLGAVVRDHRGREFTRYDRHDPQPWWLDDHGPNAQVERRFEWAEFEAVEVLSEGIE